MDFDMVQQWRDGIGSWRVSRPRAAGARDGSDENVIRRQAVSRRRRGRGDGPVVETGQERWADQPDDVWYKPYDNQKGVEQAMKDYLTWEVALVDQLKRDGDTRFRAAPKA